MIPLKAVFVISVLISGLIFSPSYSFAQSNQNDNPLSGLFEFFSQLFSSGDQSEPVIEFGEAIVVQTSGSSSTSDPTPHNILPMADAGPDQDDVMEFSKVTLDGSSSTDLDGTIISYKWTQTSGTPVWVSTNSMTTVVSPMFMAPSAQVLTFMLAVVDNSSGTDADEVIITVIKKDDPTCEVDCEPPCVEDCDPPGNDNGNEKVTICHAPPGNPDNAHTITVGGFAAEAHLIHHEDDHLGSCGGENSGRGNSGVDNSGKGNSNNVKDNDNKSNSGKGNNNDDDDSKGNSGKGNQNIKDDNDNKSNSGKGNNNDDDDNKGNSGKGNQNIKDENEGKSNSGKGNNNDDDDSKGNSGKGNQNIKDDNDNKSNSGKGNNNDDEDEDD